MTRADPAARTGIYIDNWLFLYFLYFFFFFFLLLPFSRFVYSFISNLTTDGGTLGFCMFMAWLRSGNVPLDGVYSLVYFLSGRSFRVSYPMPLMFVISPWGGGLCFFLPAFLGSQTWIETLPSKRPASTIRSTVYTMHSTMLAAVLGQITSGSCAAWVYEYVLFWSSRSSRAALMILSYLLIAIYYLAIKCHLSDFLFRRAAESHSWPCLAGLDWPALCCPLCCVSIQRYIVADAP